VAPLAGCGGNTAPAPAAGTTDASAQANLFDVPIAGLGSDWRARFNDGDRLFETDLRDADGLGPLYTRQACNDCHNDEDGLRGPGGAQKMSIVEADDLTPSPDQSALPFGPTVHPFVTAGATTPIVARADNASVRITNRIGPSVLATVY